MELPRPARSPIEFGNEGKAERTRSSSKKCGLARPVCQLSSVSILLIEIIFWLSALLFAVCAFRVLFYPPSLSVVFSCTIAAFLPLLVGLLLFLFSLTTWFSSIDPRENGLYDGPGLAESLRRVIAPLTHGVEVSITLLVIEALILFLKKQKA
jgi:hypothetical protein